MDLLQPDASWFEIDPEFYRHGGSCLNPAEAEGLDVRAGQSILVAPAGTGEEALSCANLGAGVTVLGDGEMLDRVRKLTGARA